MLKLFSKNYNSEVLVNQSRIQYIVPTFDGSIVHFDSGNVLPVTNTLTDIEHKVNNQKIIPTQEKKALHVSVEEVNLVKPGEKIWPDEFPDDFPRFKNGTIVKNSKKYLEYMKAKENV